MMFFKGWLLLELQWNSVKYAWGLNVNLNVRINPNFTYETFVLLYFPESILRQTVRVTRPYGTLKPTCDESSRPTPEKWGHVRLLKPSKTSDEGIQTGYALISWPLTIFQGFADLLHPLLNVTVLPKSLQIEFFQYPFHWIRILLYAYYEKYRKDVTVAFNVMAYI